MGFVKPVRVARFGGTSSTEATNSAEPSSGKKDLGWVLNEAPPSSFFNWLHYRAYKWFRWLNERMFDGVTNDDLVVQGVDGAVGPNVKGGDLDLSGGQATGSESSDVTIKAATAGASGSTIRTPETYFQADGNAGVARMLRDAVATGTPGSAGDALTGSATSGTGHGVAAAALVVAPVKTAWRGTPQASDASSPLTGDFYTNATNGQIAHYNALADPQRFQNLDALIKETTADSTPIANTTSLTQFNQTGSIPADSLRVGSVIRVRAWGEYSSTGSPNLIVGVRVGGQGLGTVQLLSLNSSGGFMVIADLIVRGPLTASCVAAVIQRVCGNINQALTSGGGTITFDATSAALVEVQVQWSAASPSNSVTMTGLTVEVI